MNESITDYIQILTTKTVPNSLTKYTKNLIKFTDRQRLSVKSNV